VSELAEPSPAAWRGWWLVPEAAVLVVLILVAMAAPPGRGPDQAVADLAARTIENLPPGQHQEHGHEVAAGSRLFCGVDVFGTDPPGVPVE